MRAHSLKIRICILCQDIIFCDEMFSFTVNVPENIKKFFLPKKKKKKATFSSPPAGGGGKGNKKKKRKIKKKSKKKKKKKKPNNRTSLIRTPLVRNLANPDKMAN